ncbi:RNA-guided endonuclease InsQ/TnpB family protein [Actinomadura darangshiensis]|uniref:RNA-guided endonuclease InsQ/TnpB family protein n=1 Tax=Actinomadura darangshiensis TaxID=705336 RepID=UPI001FB853F2|nr:transposase [Actinomadura darangshiensis]
MRAGRRYRLQFTPEQAVFADRIGGTCRSVWNTALEQRRSHQRRGAFISYREQAAQLAEAKREPGLEWLVEAPGHCLQQTLLDLDAACRVHGPWKVHWRGRSGSNRWTPSFRFPEGGKIRVERLNRKTGRVRLPKLGWVRFRWSRPLGGSIRSATLKRDGRHWYVSFLVDTGRPEKAVSLQRGRTGVDRGVANAIATSDGNFFDRSFLSDGEQERLRRLERRRSKCRPGSRRRQATREKIRIIRRRERDRRRDFCVKAADLVVSGNALVVLEKLNIRGMTASAKGTAEEPGTNVAAKTGQNRAILDKGWHLFELAVRNKSRVTGAVVRTINPAYTSLTCPAEGCGNVDANNRKSQAEFACTCCGHAEHADTVGAKNTLARGHSGFRAWRPPAAGRVDEAPTSGKP